MTPEQEQDLFMFMGEVRESLGNIKEDLGTVRKLENDFSNLKGKLLAIAGIITFVLNGAWEGIKKFL